MNNAGWYRLFVYHSALLLDNQVGHRQNQCSGFGRHLT